MAKTVKNTASGLYLVKGSGFVGTSAQATRFDSYEAANAAVACAADMGVRASIENAVDSDPNIKQNASGVSFAPSYIRKKDLRADGSVAANGRNPSTRRFATRAEAQKHIDRFVKLEGHVGGFITESRDPVNAYINPLSGFTNPEIGKKRLGASRQPRA